MKIEAICNDLNLLRISLLDKALITRGRAENAKTAGNKGKANRLYTAGGIYESAASALKPICEELFSHTPKSYRNRKRDPRKILL